MSITASAQRRRRWLTWANGLTASRLVTAPLLALAILRGAHGVALVIFVAAVLTDFLDGRVARRTGEASSLGGVLDHATDAIFVTAGTGALGCTGEVPQILPWLIAAAFVQYVLDSRIAAGRSLRTSVLGRWNGVSYFVLLGIPVVRDGLGLAWPGAPLVNAIGWALVASTLISMAHRLRVVWRPGAID
jgi:phosphatidylglycerophosphate synthase